MPTCYYSTVSGLNLKIMYHCINYLFLNNFSKHTRVFNTIICFKDNYCRYYNNNYNYFYSNVYFNYHSFFPSLSLPKIEVSGRQAVHFNRPASRSEEGKQTEAANWYKVRVRCYRQMIWAGILSQTSAWAQVLIQVKRCANSQGVREPSRRCVHARVTRRR